MSTGQHAPPRRTADRGGGIEPIQHETVRRQPIEMRRGEVGVTLIAGVAPPEVVSHYEHDVGSRDALLERGAAGTAQHEKRNKDGVPGPHARAP